MHRGWLADAMHRVGYKSAVPDEAEEGLEAHEMEGLRMLIEGLGYCNQFSQEEQALFKKLEVEGKVIKGSAGDDEDPRTEADRLYMVTMTQRKVLDRMQKQCETLARQRAQFSKMADECQRDIASLTQEVENTENCLESIYSECIANLQSFEQECANTSRALAAGTVQDKNVLCCFNDVSELEEGSVRFGRRTAETAERLIKSIGDAEGLQAFTEHQKELSRLHDSHVMSQFGLIFAESEQASAEAELEFLKSVALHGNPDVTCSPDDLRSTIAAEKSQTDTMKDAIKSRSREILRSVQTKWLNPIAPSVMKSLEIEESRLNSHIEALDDVLYFQRQWYAVEVVARGWLAREAKGAEMVRASVESCMEIIENHCDLAGSLSDAKMNASPGRAQNFEDLIYKLDPASGFGAATLGEAADLLTRDLSILEDALARYPIEDRATDTTLSEAFRQLLTCLDSKRDADPVELNMVVPQTYFQSDLDILKEEVDESSKRLLRAMDKVEKAKSSVDKSWATKLDIKPRSNSYPDEVVTLDHFKRPQQSPPKSTERHYNRSPPRSASPKSASPHQALDMSIGSHRTTVHYEAHASPGGESVEHWSPQAEQDASMDAHLRSTPPRDTYMVKHSSPARVTDRSMEGRYSEAVDRSMGQYSVKESPSNINQTMESRYSLKESPVTMERSMESRYSDMENSRYTVQEVGRGLEDHSINSPQRPVDMSMGSSLNHNSPPRRGHDSRNDWVMDKRGSRSPDRGADSAYKSPSKSPPRIHQLPAKVITKPSRNNPSHQQPQSFKPGSAPPVRMPSFLLRPDGTRMSPTEYRERNMKLMQKFN